MVVRTYVREKYCGPKTNSKLNEIRATALDIYTELSAVHGNAPTDEVGHQLLGLALEQEIPFLDFSSKHQ